MKTKSHLSQFAIALCALATFSFTAAQASRIPPTPQPGPTVLPIGVDVIQPKPVQTYPPIQPPVNSGTYNGTVMD